MSQWAKDEMHRQLFLGPDPDTGFFLLKVRGRGESKWVGVSPKELRQIAVHSLEGEPNFPGNPRRSR